MINLESHLKGVELVGNLRLEVVEEGLEMLIAGTGVLKPVSQHFWIGIKLIIDNTKFKLEK